MTDREHESVMLSLAYTRREWMILSMLVSKATADFGWKAVSGDQSAVKQFEQYKPICERFNKALTILLQPEAKEGS